MNPLLRSAARAVLRSAARRTSRARSQARKSEKDIAIAEIKQVVRDHLRARDAAAKEDLGILPTQAGIMIGILGAYVLHVFKPPEKTSVERYLELTASNEESGAN